MFIFNLTHKYATSRTREVAGTSKPGGMGRKQSIYYFNLFLLFDNQKKAEEEEEEEENIKYHLLQILWVISVRAPFDRLFGKGGGFPNGIVLLCVCVCALYPRLK